jgi:uncharacterized membrane protein YidH (DUF202 family)
MESNLVIFIVLCFVLIGLLAFVGTKYMNNDKLNYEPQTYKFKTEYLIAIGALVIFIVIFGLKL